MRYCSSSLVLSFSVFLCPVCCFCLLLLSLLCVRRTAGRLFQMLRVVVQNNGAREREREIPVSTLCLSRFRTFVLSRGDVF